VLLRLWGGALASGDRYLVHVHDRSIDVALRALLALIAVWLEHTAEGRYPTSTNA
jgi:hypothetical protein